MGQIRLPNQVLTRFVQLYIDDVPHFICDDVDEHSGLLASVLMEYGIVFRSRWGIPNALGDRYASVGMGFCGKIGDDYLLSGSSVHYKLSPNLDHLMQLRQKLPQGVSIKIENIV